MVTTVMMWPRWKRVWYLWSKISTGFLFGFLILFDCSWWILTTSATRHARNCLLSYYFTIFVISFNQINCTIFAVIIVNHFDLKGGKGDSSLHPMYTSIRHTLPPVHHQANLSWSILDHKVMLFKGYVCVVAVHS